MTSDDRLTLKPIGAEVADRLEAAIIREEFPPGAKLREEELSARYGVSRSPLREAFQILEGRGLVERRPRLGARVTSLSLTMLDDITTCRVPLEATAAALLAARDDRQQAVRRLRSELVAMQRAADRGDSRAGFEANVRMTDILHGACGNPVLVKLLDQLNKSALRYRFRAYRSAPAILTRMVEGNGAMIEAIARGDTATAATVTERLLRDAWALSRAALEAAAAEDGAESGVAG
ncbi:GntR family transcriptional regulator [Halodurantibacterium flavum]|uniref:GntR family transcriptional regulator n=1 Tax=Halodurantibacterium flavum TaxID=1382802 RepID=A0ABW4S2C2_9RHOB